MKPLARGPRIILFALAVAAIATLALIVPVQDVVETLQAWRNQQPLTAFFAMVGAAAIGIVLVLPITPMALLCGFLFGLSKGLLIIWLGGMMASSITFALGNTLARPWMERKVRQKPIFLAIDRAIQRRGFLIVLLSRLVMVVPYTLLNYTLGLTGVSFRIYFLGTNLGMLPPFALLVFLGTTAKDLAAVMSGDIQVQGVQWLLGGATLLLVLALAVVTFRVAGRTLREELVLATAQPEADEPESVRQ